MFRYLSYFVGVSFFSLQKVVIFLSLHWILNMFVQSPQFFLPLKTFVSNLLSISKTDKCGSIAQSLQTMFWQISLIALSKIWKANFLVKFHFHCAAAHFFCSPPTQRFECIQCTGSQTPGSFFWQTKGTVWYITYW